MVDPVPVKHGTEPRNVMVLKGQTAIVTGSTSGIGLGIADALAHAGANVVINGFGDPAQLEQLRARLEAESGSPMPQ